MSLSVLMEIIVHVKHSRSWTNVALSHGYLRFIYFDVLNVLTHSIFVHVSQIYTLDVGDDCQNDGLIIISLFVSRISTQITQKPLHHHLKHTFKPMYYWHLRISEQKMTNLGFSVLSSTLWMTDRVKYV